MILLKKVLRDLRHNAVQFFSIYIMTLLSLFVQTGFESSNVGSAYSVAEYFAETNYKDLDIQGAYFTYKDIEMLENTPGVSAVDGIARTTGKITLDKERLLVWKSRPRIVAPFPGPADSRTYPSVSVTASS